MLYSLPTGKVVELSVEQFLAMSDDDFDLLAASNSGDEINDPFFKSVLRNVPYGIDDEFDIDLDQIEEYIPDLTDISDDEKLSDPDFHHQDE